MGHDNMTRLRVSILTSYGAVDAQAWDALVANDSPFTRCAWLAALESSGGANEATGWSPRPILVHQGERLVGAAPAWLHTDSSGEYVWDGAWQTACLEAELPYYPKVVVGVPWTPATGRRFFVSPQADQDAVMGALMHGLQRTGGQGIHVLFPREDELLPLERVGLFRRHQLQFHWHNAGYRSYDDFLLRLRSRHRKRLRAERRAVADLRYTTTLGPSVSQVDLLYDFWAATCARYNETPPLPRAFFETIAHTMADQLVAIIAWDGQQPVAGALNVQGARRLYGRYWGTNIDRPQLHFEVCYHRGIDWCIERGLSAFEPGHGGDHKQRRGFEPSLTWSAHAFANPRVHTAFANYASREAVAMDKHIEKARSRDMLRGR